MTDIGLPFLRPVVTIGKEKILRRESLEIFFERIEVRGDVRFYV